MHAASVCFHAMHVARKPLPLEQLIIWTQPNRDNTLVCGTAEAITKN